MNANDSKRNSQESTPEKKEQRKKTTFQTSQSKRQDQQIEATARSLLDGSCSVSDIEVSYITDVTFWLRKYKTSLLKKADPDYETAKRIDNLTSDLKIAGGANQYNEFQDEKIQNISTKLEEAKRNHQTLISKKKTSKDKITSDKNEALQKLEEEKMNELDKIDDKYQGDELPPKFKKYSTDVIQMRQQENYLKRAGLYDEAKRMKEERDAVEKYELEMRKNERGREWNIERDKCIKKFEQQKSVINYKFDLRWDNLEPEYNKGISYWERVINNLEERLKNEKSLKREAQIETSASLSSYNKRGLPHLQYRTTRTTPTMTRVISVSQTRTYTRPRTVQQSRKMNQSRL